MDLIERVFRRRDRIERLVNEYLDAEDGVGSFQVSRLTDIVLDELPPGCQYGALHRTTSGLTGPIPNAETVRNYAWAVAANVASLKAGTVVVPGRVTGRSKVVVQILGAKALTRGKPAPGKEGRVMYRGRVIVGPGTPTDFTWTWSVKFVSYLARRPDGLGFDRSTKPTGHPYRHYASLVGTRMCATIKTVDGRIRPESVTCPGSLRAHNKRLVLLRERRSGFTCPFGFTHPCHTCPKGRSSCPAAVRALDLVETVCPQCQRPFTADPAWRETVCRRCEGTNKRGRS